MTAKLSSRKRCKRENYKFCITSCRSVVLDAVLQYEVHTDKGASMYCQCCILSNLLKAFERVPNLKVSLWKICPCHNCSLYTRQLRLISLAQSDRFSPISSGSIMNDKKILIWFATHFKTQSNANSLSSLISTMLSEKFLESNLLVLHSRFFNANSATWSANSFNEANR